MRSGCLSSQLRIITAYCEVLYSEDASTEWVMVNGRRLPSGEIPSGDIPP